MRKTEKKYNIYIKIYHQLLYLLEMRQGLWSKWIFLFWLTGLERHVRVPQRHLTGCKLNPENISQFQKLTGCKINIGIATKLLFFFLPTWLIWVYNRKRNYTNTWAMKFMGTLKIFSLPTAHDLLFIARYVDNSPRKCLLARSN